MLTERYTISLMRKEKVDDKRYKDSIVRIMHVEKLHNIPDAMDYMVQLFGSELKDESGYYIEVKAEGFSCYVGDFDD